ncbi:16S rRNA (guanine(527)-N(7))-methyltransferase RsmG [Paracoccus sediminicola]|uniref:16S rRNA (guanine(527)-N(7))-methyltransferase RsmG n=1 Tax=Paracoccus sediminicola TaxID=3017783 RepID=UPI0022F12FE6|nr:16S rRNA (guanine(527)-N(7))-methyltransferase RsmG [Paracoccus sediminicola]WBU56354.1 16S rRNA (guanine(527)-N(7))-methyltransferase RsmG [Paracoccus sediminicola]
MSVSRETKRRLDAYTDLLIKWNRTINLVAPSTINSIHHRHISDSAQLYTLATPTDGRWLDLGSGGGLPGVVIAIMAAGTNVEFELVESDTRKAAFLRTVARELSLPNLAITAKRIESLPTGDHQFVSARALAPLKALLPHVHRLMSRDGATWLLKGRNWKREVEEARRSWRFDIETYQSVTDAASAVIQLRNIEQND